MSEYKILKLKFKGAVHFGGIDERYSTEGSQPTPLADTLFSAICHGYGSLYGQNALETMLKAFVEGTPPFVLSDGMVYSNNEYYLPKPIVSGEKDDAEKVKDNKDNDDEPNKKAWKKIQWLRVLDTVKFVNGRLKEIPKIEEFYKEDTVTKATISRNTNETGDTAKPYQVGSVRYSKDCGCYIIFAINDSDYRNKLEAVFELLGEIGIGGRRSSGYGKFVPQWEECPDNISKRLSAKTDKLLLLSHSVPRDGDEALTLKKEGAYYQLVNRKGHSYSSCSSWQGQSLKKKTVFMVKSGSILSQKINGRLVDITPETNDITPSHRLYRYGYAMTMNISLEDN